MRCSAGTKYHPIKYIQEGFKMHPSHEIKRIDEFVAIDNCEVICMASTVGKHHIYVNAHTANFNYKFRPDLESFVQNMMLVRSAKYMAAILENGGNTSNLQLLTLESRPFHAASISSAYKMILGDIVDALKHVFYLNPIYLFAEDKFVPMNQHIQLTEKIQVSLPCVLQKRFHANIVQIC